MDAPRHCKSIQQRRSSKQFSITWMLGIFQSRNPRHLSAWKINFSQIFLSRAICHSHRIIAGSSVCGWTSSGEKCCIYLKSVKRSVDETSSRVEWKIRKREKKSSGGFDFSFNLLLSSCDECVKWATRRAEAKLKSWNWREQIIGMAAKREEERCRKSTEIVWLAHLFSYFTTQRQTRFNLLGQTRAVCHCADISADLSKSTVLLCD